MEKVFPADRHSGVAIAGAAGPAATSAATATATATPTGRRPRRPTSIAAPTTRSSPCPAGPPGRNVSWLRQEAEDRWRVVEGRELGEQLRVVRDEAGEPVRLYLATYPLTRDPAAFADVAR